MLLPTAQNAAAQDTGTVSATVIDASGQVLPGATVTLTDEATAAGRTMVTTDRGEFTFRAVQPGTYTVAVELSGFRRYERQHNVVNASGQLNLGEVRLEIGALTEAVTVTAQGTIVETRNSDYSGLLTSNQIARFKPRGATSSTCCGSCPASTTRTTSTRWATVSDRSCPTSPASGAPGTR